MTWLRDVTDLYGRRCMVSAGRAVQAHHVVPKHVIRRAHHLTPTQRGELAADPVNGLPVSVRVHERHETATERIPRAVLTAEHIAWAEKHGFGWYIDDRRIYP